VRTARLLTEKDNGQKKWIAWSNTLSPFQRCA
jgi:hypothetical protein